MVHENVDHERVLTRSGLNTSASNVADLPAIHRTITENKLACSPSLTCLSKLALACLKSVHSCRSSAISELCQRGLYQPLNVLSF